MYNPDTTHCTMHCIVYIVINIPALRCDKDCGSSETLDVLLMPHLSTLRCFSAALW